MFRPARRFAVLAAAVAFGVVESIALLRSRVIEGLIRFGRQLTGP